jgi:hypothetical protein
VINSFRLYLGFKEFTVRTDCEAICKYYNQINSKKSSTRRWVLLEDIVTGNGYKVIFEHIKGKDNKLSNLFSHVYVAGMKRSMNHIGVESFSFGNDNKLKIFPLNSFKFKPKDHIIVDEVQECILDNF